MNRKRRQTLVLSGTVFAVPALAGALLGLVGESTAVGALLLYVEPLLLSVAVYFVLVFLLGQRWLPGAALGLGTLLGGQLLRLAPQPQPVTAPGSEWAERLRGCTIYPDPVTSPIRVLVWTLDPRQPVYLQPEDLVATAPDIIVLHGVDDALVGEELASLLDGEAITLASPDRGGGTSMVVRGVFQYCGGHQDRWEAPLPAADDHTARLVVAFPEVRDAGVVPLMVVRLDGPGGPASWATWPQRILAGSREVAAVARAVNPHRMVVAGDFAVPRTFRRVAGLLLGAGLVEAIVPASWPARLGPLPSPTLHALDRVWIGESWRVSTARTLYDGGQARKPVVVDLAPAEAQAR